MENPASPGSSPNVAAAAVYNTRPLVLCDTSYLGSALPTMTTQPPGIIHEPLEKICEKENLPTFVSTPKKPVRLYIFHSGIVIKILFGKHNGEHVWYPIQSLYCSASLQPLKTKHGTMEFKSLDSLTSSKSALKPIFAMVIRETVQKKVLQCHAFAVARREVAQLLVQATAVAYREKKGWNLPLNIEHLRDTEYCPTLNITDEVHPDSGYSDHDDSSQKSTQSPQGSELLTDDSSKNQMDNQSSTKSSRSSGSRPSSATSSITVTRDMTLPSPPYINSTLVNQPTPSSTQISPSVGLREIQSEPPMSDQNSGDERGSTRSIKSAASLSSGYPLSRNSSSIVTARHQINPHMMVIQRVNSASTTSGRIRSKHDSSPMSMNRSNPNISLPLESLSSLSLDQPPSHKTGDDHHQFRKTKTIPKVEVINVDGIPRRVIHYETHYEPTSPNSYSNENFSHPVYGEPVYVPYHPDQFMYEGERYLNNNTYVEHNPSAHRSKERHKSSKDSKKKTSKNTKWTNSGGGGGGGGQIVKKLDDGSHLSMERRLTKIRQLL